MSIHSSRASGSFPCIEWSKQTKSTYVHFIVLVLQIFPSLGDKFLGWVGLMKENRRVPPKHWDADDDLRFFLQLLCGII